MANAGLSFEIDPSGVDEEEVTRSLLAQRSSPQEIAEALAEMKALRVSSRRPGALVVGGDSTLASSGRLFDKPPDLATARVFPPRAIHLLRLVNCGSSGFMKEKSYRI